MTKKKVLILGASGFIGKNTFDRLIERNDLSIIGAYHTNQYNRFADHQKGFLTRVNLTDKKQVTQITKNIDIIIQAAAMTSGIKDTSERPWIQITDNAVMNSLIFEAAHINHVKQVICFSSSIVYPPHTDRALTEFDVDPNALSLKHRMAAKTKIYLEDLGKFYADLGRTKYTIIRPANLYGPHDRFDLERSHVLAAIITKVLAAKDGKITLWGDGHEQKDFLYVSDLVDLVELCIEDQKNSIRVFNAGSGELISVRDLAQKIIALSGQNLKTEWDASGPTAPTSILLDNHRVNHWLEWSRKVNLDAGLAKTIDWFKLNQLREKYAD